MLNQQEYEKLVKGNKNINKDNMYNVFTDIELKVIKKYFELLTCYEYKKMRGTLRLEVLPEKADKLKELKGEGVWEFAGLEDMQKRGLVKCELGHSIRYVYKARNVSNDKMLYFGSHCVSDFFYLDNISVQIMNRLKFMMLSEIENIAIIKSLGLYNEYLCYDCKLFGSLCNMHGVDIIDKLGIEPNLNEIVKEFLSNKIPFPKSLIDLMSSYSLQIENTLYDLSNFDIVVSDLEELKNSPITLISNMFTFSENDIINIIKTKGIFDKESDFYNFLTPNDLNIACHIWKNRNIRILKAQEYFRSIGITKDWILLYRKMIETKYNQNVNFYQAVEILLLFDKDITLDFTLELPHSYKYQGYYLNKGSYEKFDMLIDYLSTKEFYQGIKEVQEMVLSDERAEDVEKKRIDDMMTFLREHIEDSCYKNIKGIAGVYDIIKVKKKEYSSMTLKQQKYVLGIYDLMQDILKESEKSGELNRGVYINKKYSLIERPDILSKIQQLQMECYDNLTSLQQNIIHSIMTNHSMTDRQIVQIEKAYSQNILHENVENKNVILNVGDKQNKKYSLLERPDIKEKIETLMNLFDYYNIPIEIRNIFSNILKYNRVSEKQAKTVENTYRRYIGHD